jgi:hypothetical protein
MSGAGVALPFPADAGPAWVRSAFWIGRPKPGQEAAFRHGIDQVMVPAMAALPGVRSIQALWPVHLEDNPPALHCQVLVAFDSRADLERMVASDARRALRPGVLALVAAFDGHISHIESTVGQPC